MTTIQLVSKLKDLYFNAPQGSKGTMVNLFGVVYAKEIKDCGVSVQEIAEKATGKDYTAEINKGIGLSRYVVLKKGIKI